MPKENFPSCRNNRCFANDYGKCVILTDNDFNGRSCPFFKTKAQLDFEEKKRKKRLGEKQ